MGREWWWKLVLVGACVGAALALATPALASSPPVRVGMAPRPAAGAKVVGGLAADRQIGVTVTLEPRDPAALAAYATAVATAGSSVYHQYLSVGEFAQRFGPSPAQIAAVEASLRAHGLSPGAVSANGLAIEVPATAGALAQAFSTSFERVALPGGRIAFANTAAPALDASVAGYVQGVLGLDSLSLAHPLGLHAAPEHAHGALSPHVVTGGPQPCPEAVAAATSNGVYTADQLASAYSFSGLYGAGDLGAGQTVAIYELEPDRLLDIAAYQSCYGTSPRTVTYTKVDGFRATGAGQGEAALDIEDVIGLAPQANIIVYQGPNTNAGAYDTYNAIISDDTAQVISTSWGACEPQEGADGANSESTLFQEAAVQGQTIVAAAGDNGSEDCGTSSLRVDDPASQPFVTGVGGTSLAPLGPPPSEAVWNDSCQGSPCAGGGGISMLWPMPSYQASAPASLNVINTNSAPSPSPCGAAAGSYCREVPDVSANADPSTGYLIYYAGGWTGIGGTSAAAPLWAALTALVNASSACSGSPIGFATPALYRVGGSSDYLSAFNDVTSGNNDIVGNTGLYPASAGYDMASGLGTPIAPNLAAYLCDRSTVTTANPGTQVSLVGASVSLQVAGTSSAGAGLHYAATGLPVGLSINAVTGVVSGTPTTAENTTTTVSASTADGISGAASFSWTVVSGAVGVANPGTQRGTVGVPIAAVQIHATDNNTSALRYSATGLPAGLAIGSSSGVISGTPTAAGSSTVVVKATAASGPSATASFRWAIAAVVSFTHASLSGVRKGKPKLSFTTAAATGSPSLRAILVGLPRGLSFSHKRRRLSRGIRLTGPGGNRLKFTANLSHGELTIKLRAAAPSVKVTISPGALSESKSLKQQVSRRHVKTLSILLQATNSRNATIGAVPKLSV